MADPDLVLRVAEAIALRFVRGTGERNPDWDIDGPNDDTNPYHLTVPMSERIKQPPSVVFIDSDGCPSVRFPSCMEIAQAAVDDAAAVLLLTFEESG